MRAAIIDSSTNTVVNIIEYDAESDWVPPDGHAIHTDSSAEIGMKWNGKSFDVPAVSMADKKAALQSAAYSELVQSDSVVLRCISAGISVPSSWKLYRNTLRELSNGVGSKLPQRPDYPEGT